MGERDREAWLLEELTVNPTYDWRAWLRETYTREGRWYFDIHDEDLLAEGWNVRQPLAELCGQLHASDMHIAKHLIAMGPR